MDRLLANELFCRVVETGSFTAAAREARLPQPSVSRMIAALEEALALRLFDRTTRRVVPTMEGRAYYAHVEEAVRTLGQAEIAARGGFSEVAGHVRIAVPGALGRRVLVPRVVAMLLESPTLRVDLSVSDQPVDFVGGGFDFAVRVGKQPDSSFVAREIARSPQWVVASPGYLSMRGVPASFAGHHIVLRGVPPKSLLREGVEVRMITDEIETAHGAVLAGLGLSVLPRWLVAADVKEGRLVHVLPELDVGTMPVVATYPSPRRLRKPARRVLDRLSVAIRAALA
jgi:DNA-binding transcriptional LysR family regulator